MKRLLRWTAGITAVLFVVTVALLFGRNWLLKQVAIRSVEVNTGLRAEIGRIHSGLRSPFLQLQQVKLYNQPEFGGGLLLDAPEFFASFDAALAAAGRLNFTEMRVSIAELTVIRDAQGRLNLEQVEKEYRKRDEERRRRRGKNTNELEFAGIERLDVSIGRILYVDHEKPKRNAVLRIGLTNEVTTTIKTEDDLLKWTGSIIFRVLAEQLVEALNERSGRRRFELRFDPEPDQVPAAP
jgi:uncharacterized protein involved in outer membrane biogenesis